MSDIKGILLHLMWVGWSHKAKDIKSTDWNVQTDIDNINYVLPWKQDVLTAWDNITIEWWVISSTWGWKSWLDGWSASTIYLVTQDFDWGNA